MNFLSGINKVFFFLIQKVNNYMLKCEADDKLFIIEIRSFNMEIFIKAQFSIVQMSSSLKLHAVAWFEARY